MLDNLSNNNPLLWDEVSDKPVIWGLNMMMYYGDKAKHIEKQYEQVNRKGIK